MSQLDLAVLIVTLVAIAAYGVWKTRGSRDLEGYLRGDHTMRWGTIGLSVMATQASAITFLSTPGLAYEKGMAFVQNYLGLPLALVVVSMVFVPIYYRLRVYTAYEFLEKRFNLRTRQLGAFLFLVQRGLAAGITIYAPAIIITSLVGWDLNWTILLVGVLVIIYTASGGTRAVSLTQKYQMGVILVGMIAAFFLIIYYLSDVIPFYKALAVAGKMGKLEVIDFSLDYSKRYTIWSGIFGGFFLALSYFGTDQSQVQRYLSARSVTECRMGLMFNALFKVPMQFFILLVGVMVFLFFQFVEPPVFFKKAAMEASHRSAYSDEMRSLENEYSQAFASKRTAIQELASTLDTGDELAIAAATREVKGEEERSEQIRSAVKELLVKVDPKIETKDSDYVFITFITTYLPRGVVGLLIAVMLCAAMSSTSSELNALASTTTVDFYQRVFRKGASDQHYVRVSKLLTAGWGVVAITFAMTAYLVESLIEAVNILGSLFYGTILGIFLVAFALKFIRGNAVFLAAVVAQGIVILLFFMSEIGYLWYNIIGCVLVVALGTLFQRTVFRGRSPASV